eukprot:scaffold163384_cov22-Prasinocladus_malaysianus.AAC.1
MTCLLKLLMIILISSKIYWIQYQLKHCLSGYAALGGESVTPFLESDPELIYMKLFKDVCSLDIDMMIPGSSLNFSESLMKRLEYLRAWPYVLYGLLVP